MPFFLTPPTAISATSTSSLGTAEKSTGPVFASENEIWGQRISATGTPLGNRLRISQQGPDSNTAFNATESAIVANPFQPQLHGGLGGGYRHSVG